MSAHSPVGSGAVSTSFALSVTGALSTSLPVAAISHHSAVLVLLALALVIFQADAVAVLGTGLDLAGQASGTRLPLSVHLGIAPFQRHAAQKV